MDYLQSLRATGQKLKWQLILLVTLSYQTDSMHKSVSFEKQACSHYFVSTDLSNGLLGISRKYFGYFTKTSPSKQTSTTRNQTTRQHKVLIGLLNNLKRLIAASLKSEEAGKLLHHFHILRVCWTWLIHILIISKSPGREFAHQLNSWRKLSPGETDHLKTRVKWKENFLINP